MSEVKQHYDRTNLVETIGKALKSAGLGGKQLSLKELAPLDHFHSRGIAATEELAEILNANQTSKILDIGSGLGGPARYFAQHYGAHVTGIDLTPSYVEAAAYLTQLTGLSDKAIFQCANALELPFADNSFDIAITQHVAMNIEDRQKLYSEAFRVLKPGGKFAFYDVVAGNDGEVYFPVPWASTPKTSFLWKPEDLQSLLEKQGFKVLSWLDRTESGITWFDRIISSMPQTPTSNTNAIGLNILFDGDFKIRAGNLKRSLQEDKAALLEAVLQRP